MIVKYQIKKDKKTNNNKLIVWLQKLDAIERDIQEVFSFFEKDIVIKTTRRYRRYYKITSNKPIIMISIISTLHELIPEMFFNEEDIANVEEEVNLLSIKDL